MEIVVYGSLGGFKPLYQTPKAPQIASDVCKAVTNEDVIGQTAYSLAFMESGMAFTKYMIVRDTPRNFATGTVAASLYLPVREKLSGIDVKTALDSVLQHYCDNYVKSNNTNCGERERIIQTDWSFVDPILKKYNEKITPNPYLYNDEYFQEGTAEAAYIYYSTDEELQKYFDEPCQYEFKKGGYCQIFFVESELQNNPLTVIKHNPKSELTGKIDLENTTYILQIEKSQDGETIKVMNNGRQLVSGQPLKRNDNLEIEYTKQYCEKVSAKFHKISNEYVTVDDEKKIVTVKGLILKIIRYDYCLKITDPMGNHITNANISYNKKDEQQKLYVENNKITFTGEEIRYEYIITVETHKYRKIWSFFPNKFIGNLEISMPFETNDAKKPIVQIESEKNNRQKEYDLKDELENQRDDNDTDNITKTSFLKEKWKVIVPSVVIGFIIGLIIGFIVAFLLFNNQKINETIVNQTLKNSEELENVKSTSEAEIVIENQEITIQSDVNPQTKQTPPSNAQTQHNPLTDEVEMYLRGVELLPSKLNDFRQRLETAGISSGQTYQRLLQAIAFRNALQNGNFNNFDENHGGSINTSYSWGRFWQHIKSNGMRHTPVQGIVGKPLSEIMTEYKYQP